MMNDEKKNSVKVYENSDKKKELLIEIEDTAFYFILIPAGEFMMGSCLRPKHCSPDEKPRHRVKLGRDFWMGKYPVTIRQWNTLSPDRPFENRDYCGESDDCPASHISWEDAVLYSKSLGGITGLNFRLPFEAEWEYCARAGADEEYYWGKDEPGSEIENYAWYYANTGEKGLKCPQPVGSKLPNSFGLYDMAGNVWEWCADFYKEDYYEFSPLSDPRGPVYGKRRILRGGSWGDDPRYLRSSVRDSYFSYKRWYLNGFRLLLQNII